MTINAAGTLDTAGRSIDGDRDGKAGGDFQATLGRAGIRLSRWMYEKAASGETGLARSYYN